MRVEVIQTLTTGGVFERIKGKKNEIEDLGE